MEDQPAGTNTTTPRRKEENRAGEGEDYENEGTYTTAPRKNEKTREREDADYDMGTYLFKNSALSAKK